MVTNATAKWLIVFFLVAAVSATIAIAVVVMDEPISPAPLRAANEKVEVNVVAVNSQQMSLTVVGTPENPGENITISGVLIRDAAGSTVQEIKMEKIIVPDLNPTTFTIELTAQLPKQQEYRVEVVTARANVFVSPLFTVS